MLCSKQKFLLRHRLVFLWTSDEEIGSDASRKLIETEARRSDAVFVLEPSLGPKGLLKTARKGVGEAELIVQGRASHAGLAPEEGVNAIHELSRQLLRVQEWNDLRRGVTVNADIIEGGTRVNVIAEHARAVLDLRALRVSDMAPHRAQTPRAPSYSSRRQARSPRRLQSRTARTKIQRSTFRQSQIASRANGSYPSANALPAEALTAISPPQLAPPRLTASALSATARILRTSTS